MNDFFRAQVPECRSTGELVDEEGVIRFYSCSREPGHGGAWHTGYEFGPNRDMSVPGEPKLWPVAQRSPAES